MPSNSIRILEKDNNRRGDLFGRLMADLFVALGYEQPRLNVHKSGRELDLGAVHRFEPRRAIGECKATADPIGGDEINKFVGALDAEQDDDHPIAGYFISLAGFKETAIEQEKRRQRTKIILLSGPQVVNALIEGRILIPKERATDLAGRCCAGSTELALDPDAELLAHNRGWIWAIYFTRGKARTHFALIHSDGTPLARPLADEVITADRECKGQLHRLSCLNPGPRQEQTSESHRAEAFAAYRKHLENECGFIQLDGLPADAEVGSRQLALETLFVPLHVDLARKKEKTGEQVLQPRRGGVFEEDEVEKTSREPLGAVLGKHSRLALLAAPGGGKSTLLKRLAVAYADPARRKLAADGLPERAWMPLFFRCRELRDLARASFAELLDSLLQREGVRQYAAVLRAEADRALSAGNALLLVDGLDEISDAGDRAAFVCTLRATLQAYPKISMLVTSREAGFRHVAAHLAPVCIQATLSSFDPNDIRRLSVAWHREVLGETEKVKADAEQLADVIIASDRIRLLAINPLLLTTLLLVKRWVGSLPTRRAILYGKAVELLLMTWNVEGHKPIPQEEALPQLCYVASAMMLDGVQKISRPRLASLLKEARSALPTELGYVRGSVEEFIQRVEERSSLLMMSGHDVENGQLVEFFEFRHLTFQEFLTARAMVEGWHPGRQEADTLAGVLEPHFAEEKWREVIPLAAVLGGKATEGLLQALTQRVGKGEDRGYSNPLMIELASCLADEAAARPESVRAALREIINSQLFLFRGVSQDALVMGRYGADLYEEAVKMLFSEPPELKAAVALSYAMGRQVIKSLDESGIEQAATTFEMMLVSPDTRARCEGALGLWDLWYELLKRPDLVDTCSESLQRSTQALLPTLFSTHAAEQYAACHVLGYVCQYKFWTPPYDPDVMGRLFNLWRGGSNPEISRLAARILAGPRLGPRDEGRCRDVSISECRSLLTPRRYGNLDDDERLAVLIVAWYRRATSDEDLAKLAVAYVKQVRRGVVPELLEKLGIERSQWVMPA